jgi:hypothetical protein
MFDIRTHNFAVVNAKPSRELVSVMAQQQTIPKQSHEQAWPAEGLTRVPYRVFQTEESYRTEQLRIFHGPAWHYLALEVELREPGDFRTTKIGDTPVIVTRDLRWRDLCLREPLRPSRRADLSGYPRRKQKGL